MAKFSFKNVGVTAIDAATTAVSSSLLPIGIKTPLQLGTDEGIFAMNYNLVDQLHDNLRNLILTNWGERLCLYDYGANLRVLMTELVSDDDFDTEAVSRIKTAVTKWMSYIDLKDFLSETDRLASSKGVVARKITITYDIPALQITNKALQVYLYAI